MQNYQFRSTTWITTEIVSYWNFNDDSMNCSDRIWYLPNDKPKPTSKCVVAYYYEDIPFIGICIDKFSINILDGLVEGMGCSDCFWYPLGWSE